MVGFLRQNCGLFDDESDNSFAKSSTLRQKWLGTTTKLVRYDKSGKCETSGQTRARYSFGGELLTQSERSAGSAKIILQINNNATKLLLRCIITLMYKALLSERTPYYCLLPPAILSASKVTDRFNFIEGVPGPGGRYSTF